MITVRARGLWIGRTSGLAGVAALLAACAFAPDGRPPATPKPQRYTAVPLSNKTVTAQGVAQQLVPGQRLIPAWWRLFRNAQLDALVAEGLRGNLGLAAVERALAAAREQLSANRGNTLMPSLDLSSAGTRQRIPPGLIEGSPDALHYDAAYGMLQASYTLDLWGTVRSANQALAARVSAQSWQYEAARRQLAGNIVATAIAAATLHAQLDKARQLVNLAEADEDEMRQRHQMGAVPPDALMAASRRRAALSAQPPELEQRWLAARHALAVLLGRTPDAAPADLDLAQLQVPPELPLVVPSQLLHTRPDIEAAAAMVQAAAADVGVATGQMFPALSLTASMGRGGLWLSALSKTGTIWGIGAAISQPLFHGGALQAQRRAALATYDAAAARYRETVIAAFQNVADSLSALALGTQALAAAEQAASAAQQDFMRETEREQIGVLAPAAVRASQASWISAQLDEIRYSGARLSNTAALFVALGSPPEPDGNTAPAETLK